MRNGSAILAEALGNLANNQSVDGGNITINSNLVTLLESSQINANAFEGNGGNINITAQGLFVSPNSSITASSQFGIDGVVEINTPDTESKLGIRQLPTDTTNTGKKIAQGCAWTLTSSFYVIGRGGMIQDPSGISRDDQPLADVRNLSEYESSPTTYQPAPNQQEIVEANAMIINEKGNVELVAIVPSNNQNLGQVASNCSGDND